MRLRISSRIRRFMVSCAHVPGVSASSQTKHFRGQEKREIPRKCAKTRHFSRRNGGISWEFDAPEVSMGGRGVWRGSGHALRPLKAWPELAMAKAHARRSAFCIETASNLRRRI
eukprot:scaffold463_cov242-Pinguiococcus_pyrenoidosus.AAC.19